MPHLARPPPPPRRARTPLLWAADGGEGSAGPRVPLLLGLHRPPKAPPPARPPSPVPTLPCAPGSCPCWNGTPEVGRQGVPGSKGNSATAGRAQRTHGADWGWGGSQPRGKGRGGPRSRGTWSPNPNILKEGTDARRREGSTAGLALGGGGGGGPPGWVQPLCSPPLINSSLRRRPQAPGTACWSAPGPGHTSPGGSPSSAGLRGANADATHAALRGCQIQSSRCPLLGASKEPESPSRHGPWC